MRLSFNLFSSFSQVAHTRRLDSFAIIICEHQDLGKMFPNTQTLCFATNTGCDNNKLALVVYHANFLTDPCSPSLCEEETATKDGGKFTLLS